ncbi:hypothetical protein AXG93_2587s1450 [Marchantia polymorpha subsp. ruderalis]|uniref:Reverse transcriptase Ty1/copia-type domain-containing protein n=1 Tax=Marchantia polymorpha subsp. ruderalis TaxID=1480154 RepID=A0A176WQN7_MARPO|nr:hypothetical protein AXG93_2587s1450 [Marchantia polymorpha subsp. ruderalis]
MEREMESLIDNKTWELVETPTNQTLIDSKWVYRLKDNIGGDEARIFKARLVVRGFTNEKGVDYNEVFSPVTKYAIIRLVCALVVIFDLVMDPMDVITAVLYGYLEEVIYMRQPVGFEVKGKERLVCRLLKSLYGLKQAPKQWNTRFDEFMKAQGFLRSVYDPCVYMKKVNDETFNLIILVLYVDDMLILAKNQSDVDECKIAEAAKEAIWLDRLIMKMGLKQGVINLHCDSESALHLAANQFMDSIVKHIDIRYHFIKQAVFEKTIKLVKIDGKLNPADPLIKVIPLESFRRHCATMQVVHGEHM